MTDYDQYPDSIDVHSDVAELFWAYKEEYEKFSGEEKTVDGYLLRLLKKDAKRMENYLKISEFDLK